MTMQRQWVASIIAVSLIFAAIIYVSFFSEPRDYDAGLTRLAATAKPIIAALNRYHAKHSTYPARATDLAPYLQKSAFISSDGHNILGWHYGRNENVELDVDDYTLSYKTGWDQGLRYYRHGAEERWAYGYDGEEKDILLKP